MLHNNMSSSHVPPQKSTALKQKSKTAKKKRKHPSISRQEQFHQERQEKYEKLRHGASKALHKEAKVVKSFECQKVVRKLKQQPSPVQEHRLAFLKSFSLDKLVHLTLQRLGMFNLDPSLQTPTETSASSSEEEMELMEKLLQQKRLVNAIEVWNDKVTDYRRWMSRRQEQIESDGPSSQDDRKNNTKKKKSKKEKKSSSLAGGDGGIFVCLGGASFVEEDDTDVLDQSHEVDEYAAVVKKKNRPGQRARKAKAMAIQARKAGRTWDSSLNWREPKPNQDADGRDSRNTKLVEAKNDKSNHGSGEASTEITQGTAWKEEGKDHPSWAAARQAKKAGIVAFAGKKITFD